MTGPMLEYVWCFLYFVIVNKSHKKTKTKTVLV